MSEQRRKGEQNGKRMTPGERAINWAKATKEAWPVVLGLVGLLGYTNSDKIMRAVSIPEPDGVTEVQPGGITFEEQVAKAVTEMNARMDHLQGLIVVQEADLSASDRRNLQRLQAELRKLNDRLGAVEELVN